MKNIPKEKTLDSSLALLREGFPFIQNKCKRFHSNIFQTRLLLEKTVCIHGQEAVRLFYDTEKFRREGAVPKRVQKTLLGENGVQTMDGAAHRHRKAMFMSLMTPERIHLLMDLMTRYWKAYIGKWEKMERVVLFEDVQEIMCLAACAWAGVPLKPTEVRKRARDFMAMVDAFGGVGPRHWRGRRARQRSEKWIRKVIKQVRNRKLEATQGSPLATIAWHRDLDGKLLSRQMAAVELINILRPIVAIATYTTFAAHALHGHPEYRRRLQAGEESLDDLFVQEVRRYYPFGPFLGARVRSAFDWQGHRFQEGTLVLLDMYGTLHDPSLWDKPDEFRPERFRSWDGSPFDLIPQGGGDHYTGHRCAGEWITKEAMKLALHILTRCMTYEVPEQDLSYSLKRMPTIIKSGFMINQVHRTGGAAPAAGAQQCPFHNK